MYTKDGRAVIVITYPLTHPQKIVIDTDNLSASTFVEAVALTYKRLYVEEDAATPQDATQDAAPKPSQRGKSNGPYGIYGCFFEQLILTDAYLENNEYHLVIKKGLI